MYKHLTLSELKSLLNLPSDFKVDACIVCGSGNENKTKRRFLSLLKNKKFVREKLKKEFISKILSIKIGNRRIWFIVEYGGARLSEFIHFACMLGSKKNILVGSCGALKKGLDKFTLISPSYSYSTESSCHMYLREKKDNRFYPDRILSDKLTKLLKEKYNIVSGPIITCQAMMAETWEDIQKWSKEGFYGVEMESSTIFAVSEHFNVPSAAIFNIADNLIEKETVANESYTNKRNKLKDIQKDLFQAALEISLENN